MNEKTSGGKFSRLAFTLFAASMLLVGGAFPWLGRYLKSGKIGAGCVYGCRSGICYSADGSSQDGYCTEKCKRDSNCPIEFSCLPHLGQRLCKRRPQGEFGDRCADGESCKSGICLEFAVRVSRGTHAVGLCAIPCDPKGECPSGASCESVEGRGALCTLRGVAERAAERYFDVIEQRH